MKNLLIIQARLGSTRLPNKVIMDLLGKPMLYRIIERLTYCNEVDKILVATTRNVEDGAIEELCKNINIDCFRGSESDVLDRYYQAAKLWLPENVIRVTADCPLIDPYIVDEIIRVHINGKYDYTSNTLVETYPDGIDTEVFTFGALKSAWENADLASEREHVTPYIKFKGNYKRKSVELSDSLADKRWTVDTEKDYEVVLKIYENLYSSEKIFTMSDILDFLKENEDIEGINKGIIRNEGYLKSLNNDYVIGRKGIK